jgi:hypothetical protein
MPDFSPRRKAEAPKAKKAPDPKKNDPNKDPSKSVNLQNLLRMYGSKGSFDALIRGKFDVTKVPKEAAGPELMAKFIPPQDQIAAAGAAIFVEQLTAYNQFLGAYNDYVEQIRKFGAYGLFWKYQEQFKKFDIKLIKEVLMKGVEDLSSLLAQQLPDDNDRKDQMKILLEVQSELSKRESGEDIQLIHKQVSVQTDITKTKEGAQLEKTISADAGINTPPDDYIKTFLKNNGILIETLEKRVKEEADKKRSELTDAPIEKPTEAAETDSGAANPTSLVAAAAGAEKP